MKRIWWIASYPKSGNTWMRCLLTSIVSGQPVDINDMSVLGGGIASSRELIDVLLGVESADMTEEQAANLRPLAYEVLNGEATEPIYLKVHDAYANTPDGNPLFPLSVTAGAIYIVRNPLDVAASLASYQRTSASEAVDAMLRSNNCLGKGPHGASEQLGQYMGDWAAHVTSWSRAPFPVEMVRYEDLLADTEMTFTRVLRFLNREARPKEIRLAVENSSFERLRSQEEKAGFRANSKSGNRFFRRGVAEAWRDELPGCEVVRLRGAFASAMQGLGY